MINRTSSVLGSRAELSVFLGVGYGAGIGAGKSWSSILALPSINDIKGRESWINSSLRPTINNTNGWAASGVWSGSGWNFIQLNTLGVIGDSIGGGITQELVTPIVPTPSIGGNKR